MALRKFAWQMHVVEAEVGCKIVTEKESEEMQ